MQLGQVNSTQHEPNVKFGHAWVNIFNAWVEIKFSRSKLNLG